MAETRRRRWLNKYLEEARPKLIVEPDEREVFLCVSGRGLTPGVLGHVVHGYVEASGVNKTGSCHLFRHPVNQAWLWRSSLLRRSSLSVRDATIPAMWVLEFGTFKFYVNVNYDANGNVTNIVSGFANGVKGSFCLLLFHWMLDVQCFPWWFPLVARSKCS